MPRRNPNLEKKKISSTSLLHESDPSNDKLGNGVLVVSTDTSVGNLSQSNSDDMSSSDHNLSVFTLPNYIIRPRHMETMSNNPILNKAAPSKESRIDSFQQLPDVSFQVTKMEQQNIQLEIENQELKCELEEAREGLKVNELIATQLRDQLDKLEGKLSKETDGRQSAELKVKGLKVNIQALQVAQQRAEKVSEQLRLHIKTENEAKAIQEGIYMEQIHMLKDLKAESDRTLEQHEDLQNKLAATELAKTKAVEKFRSLTAENSKLKQDLDILKQRGEEQESRLEADIDNLKTQLLETRENGQAIQNELTSTQQMFQNNLESFQEKVKMLGMALDREADEKTAANEELMRLRSELEQNKEVLAENSNNQKLLSQQLEELGKENSIKISELEKAKETIQQHAIQVESLKANLRSSEADYKSFEVLAAERAQQLTVVKQTSKLTEERVKSLETAVEYKEKELNDMEIKLALTTERNTALLKEKENLTQQIQHVQRMLTEKEEIITEAKAKLEAQVEASYVDQQKINLMGQDLTVMQMENSNLNTLVANLKEELEKANEVAMRQSEEKEKFINTTYQLVTKEAELEAETGRVHEMEAELEYLTEVNGTLEGVVTEQKGEVIRLTSKLDHTKSELERSMTEAEKIKTTLEVEVKSKTELGQKLVNLQKHLSVEKRHARRALKKKASVETKLEPMQTHCMLLQEEMEKMKGQIKSYKNQIKCVEEQKNKWENKQASTQGDMKEMKSLLKVLQTKLTREGASRMKTVKELSTAKHDLELVRLQLNQEQGEVANRTRKCRKLERANESLREELKNVREQVIKKKSFSTVEMGTYKDMEDKVRKDLNKKLQEMNCKVEKQLQVVPAKKSNVGRYNKVIESEWKTMFENANEELQEMKTRFDIGKETRGVEKSRLKELYEDEVQRAEKLAVNLRRSKDEATQYRHEYRQMQKLLNTTQAASSAILSPSSLTSVTRVGCPSLTTPENSKTEKLLNTIRSQLDNTLARHLEGRTGYYVAGQPINMLSMEQRPLPPYHAAASVGKTITT